VRNIRDHYQLRPREERLRDQGLLPLPEMATLLGVSTSTVKNWVCDTNVGDRGWCW
jgi:DNA-binding transcriptional regulator YiaG